MSRRDDDRRDFIATWLGREILELRKQGKLTMVETKIAVDRAQAWMEREQLRDDVHEILKSNGDLATKLKELLDGN